ncbi:MAG: CehA/McbA family metallohydrolase [Candidatus Sericytochromatia bacterium]
MHYNRIGIMALALLAGCQWLPQRAAQLPTQIVQRLGIQTKARGPYQVYFGNLHSHTSYSDGILNPREAYKTAAGNGLDFMAITEHNHAAAGGTDNIFLTPELYEDLKKTAAEFNQPGKFAALYGQEFSTISSGNHMNVFNAATIIDVPNGDFRRFYEEWLPQHPEVAFIQFNHPNFKADMGLAPHDSNIPPTLRAAEERHHQAEALAEARLFPQARSRSELFNDYGFDDYQRNFAALASAAAPYLRTIEILNGPGTSPKPVGKAEAWMEEDFLFYLNQGFKIAPSADQDNHFAHWGSLHTGRTGVLAAALTPEGIYEAIRARRVFASEDSNLEVVMQANGHYMGEEFSAGGKLDFELTLRDPDEPQAGYLVQVFADQPGQETARPVSQQQLPPGIGNYRFSWQPPPGVESYAFIKVTQLNADGTQDDAWTAPIWSR